MAEQRIEVVDAKNPERLLGTMPAPEGTKLTGSIRFACYVPAAIAVAPYSNTPIHADLKVDTVTMDWLWVQTDAFTKKRKLVTYARLDKLMKLDPFRLPGETASQASYRRHVQRFG